MNRYPERKTFQYTDNNITFKSVLDPNLPAIESHIIGNYTAAESYQNSNDIEVNKNWGANTLINCIDIDWNDAQLYGSIGIASTGHLLNYIREISNILDKTKVSTSIQYKKIIPGYIPIDNIWVKDSYSSQEDIKTNIEWGAQYFVNCINISWDGADLGNDTTLTETSDLINLLKSLLDKLKLQS